MPMSELLVPILTPVPPEQKEPPPVTVYTVGLTFTVNEAVLLLNILLLQPDAFVIDLIVSVVVPVLVSFADGIV